MNKDTEANSGERTR